MPFGKNLHLDFKPTCEGDATFGKLSIQGLFTTPVKTVEMIYQDESGMLALSIKLVSHTMSSFLLISLMAFSQILHFSQCILSL